MIKEGDRIAVWFSCGAASAVAAKLTLKLFPEATVRIVNNPIAEEDSDNLRFLKDCESWLGVEVETARNPDWEDNSADTVWRKRRYMSGINGAPCTYELKKRARQIWENENPTDWLVLGFTADEVKRAERFRATERANLICPLIMEQLTKDDCFQIIREAGIRLPNVYLRGYPNANCIGCVKATSPTYWNHVRADSPEVFKAREELSRELGVRLVRVKGERIFLDELDPDAKGRPMKTLPSFECGLFCEERDD